MMSVMERGQRFVVLAAMSAIALLGTSCQESASNAAANSNNTISNSAELFSIPADQMSHVQVLTVKSTTLTRSLRLTGAVAYNNFHTTPVITQVSGPVSRMVAVPGQKVKQGEPMLYVASPDYSQLRTNYLKAKDAYALAQKA
jgi:membrane fusion protein, heavy metal efflux system